MGKLKKIYLKMNFRERVLVLVCSVVVSLLFTKILIIDEIVSIFKIKNNAYGISQQIVQNEQTLKELQSTRADSYSARSVISYKKENTGQANLMLAISDVEKRNSGFVLRKIASEKTDIQNGLEKNSYQIEVEAPFISIGGFLEKLEKSKFLTKVSNVQIIRTEKELNICRAKITLDSFAWRQ